MKKSLLMLLSIMFAVSMAFPATGLRIMEGLIIHSRILKQDVRFSVCLPENYFNTKQSFPVTYLLHGLGDDETSWLEYGQISQYADEATRGKEIVPMIFVMPQGFRTYYVNDFKGTFLYQDMFVKELVPYIDSLFRTKADRQHRALMGYSMGGFGALTLHLKYPDLFGATVPLSISIRTDQQYMAEDSSEWNGQWGRLFGAPGLAGADRITEYYKLNSPFHMLQQMSADEKKKLNIYIDNGDKEQTLCRSNEELHILMRDMNIPHQFRVRDGGHSFQYWCSALPNALRFISDAFEGKVYRGDIRHKPTSDQYPDKQIHKLSILAENAFAYVPAEYDQTDRYYPVLYFAGNFNSSQQKTIAEIIDAKIRKNKVCPMLLVFLPKNALSHFETALPLLETQLRIRKGYRFRAIAGFGEDASEVCSISLKQEQFTACILLDAKLQEDSFAGLLSAAKPKALDHTSLFIDAPDKGNYYKGNGNAHMILRDKDISHEYRVREGVGGSDWIMEGLPEIIQFMAKRFHK